MLLVPASPKWRENTPLFQAASRQLTIHPFSTSPKNPNFAFYRKLLRTGLRALKASTYFSDIPVRSVAEPGDVRKIGTRLESS